MRLASSGRIVDNVFDQLLDDSHGRLSRDDDDDDGEEGEEEEEDR